MLLKIPGFISVLCNGSTINFFDILVLEDVMGTMDALNIPTVFLQEFEQFFCCRFHHLQGIIIIHIDTYGNWIILLY